MEFPTIDKFAKEVAEKALDEITYKGKTVREWVEIIVKQQPSEDCISKVEAINRIEVRRKITCESDPYNYEEWTKGYEEGIDDAIAMINSVPPVTPERPKGKWIGKYISGATDYEVLIKQWQIAKCNKCGKEYKTPYTDCKFVDYAYCPNCGAKMEDAE